MRQHQPRTSYGGGGALTRFILLYYSLYFGMCLNITNIKASGYFIFIHLEEPKGLVQVLVE